MSAGSKLESAGATLLWTQPVGELGVSVEQMGLYYKMLLPFLFSMSFKSVQLLAENGKIIVVGFKWGRAGSVSWVALNAFLASTLG